jgi:hypothetical protein
VARSARVGSSALDFSDCTPVPPFQALSPDSRRRGCEQVFH